MLISSELVEIRKKIVEENRELQLPGKMREDFLFRQEKVREEKKLEKRLGKWGIEALRKRLEKRERLRIKQKSKRYIKNEKERLQRQRIHAGWSERARQAREKFSKYIE